MKLVTLNSTLFQDQQYVTDVQLFALDTYILGSKFRTASNACASPTPFVHKNKYDKSCMIKSD